MKLFKYFLFFFLLISAELLVAQKVIYSEPEREDTRRINFEVIGKVSGKFLIYKNYRGKNFITALDENMKQVSSEEHEFIPDDRLINIDFFPYADFAYMVYQYQRKNVVYCAAVKVDGNGKKMSEVITLDTSHIGFTTNNKIYTTINSEDKSKLMVFKINSRNRKNYIITTLLFDDALNLIKRTKLGMQVEERDEYLDEFHVDNGGDLVFAKFKRTNNDNIEQTDLVWKPAMADNFTFVSVPQKDIYLDELNIKVDNVNKRYFLTSFYYKQRRGNIDGFHFFVWDKQTGTTAMQNSVALGEELRKEAKGDANVKGAFNDYFIKNIIVKKDGGFIIGSEAYYTTSRYNNWNRYSYLYGGPLSAFDYYSYSPLYSNAWMRNRLISQGARHHADKITILSFDNAGKMQWSNVIHKEQYDDESDDRISYQIVNTGSQIHFIFNEAERRTQILNDYSLGADGKVVRNPTLKNLNRDYDFLPKYSKQVSSRQIIIPCYYRNYICFAKIDFN